MTSVAVGPIAAPEAPRNEAAERAARMFGEHSEQLFRYCLRRRGSRAEAEDAVQTTFLYAVRALARGETPECEPAWLHAIARNVCREQHRAASRRGPVAGEVDPDSLPGPQSDEAELVAGLREALDSIPERQRHALVLQEWQGLAPREIATHLELSRPATHALLSRARHSLAVALMSPRHAALGLASLVWELRAHVKALLGGASAKAAVGTVAVVGVGMGVGGAVVDRSADEPAVAQPSLVREVAGPQAPEPSRARTASPQVARPSSAGGSVGRRAARLKQASIPSRTGPAVSGSLVVRRPLSAPGAGEPAPSPRGDGDITPMPEREPTHVVPPPPLVLPEPELPTALLPPVDLPAVDLPPVDLPALPPVDVPPVDVPPVDPPPLPRLP